MKKLKRRSESGQTATEMMMVISVIVIAVVGATQYLLQEGGPWSQGFNQYSGLLDKQIDRGWVGGHGSPGGPHN